MSSVISGLSIRLVLNNPTLPKNTGDHRYPATPLCGTRSPTTRILRLKHTLTFKLSGLLGVDSIIEQLGKDLLARRVSIPSRNNAENLGEHCSSHTQIGAGVDQIDFQFRRVVYSNMSVTPAASQTRVLTGTGITPSGPGSAAPRPRGRSRR